MNTIDPQQTENTTISKEGSRMWGLDLDMWNTLMLWALGLAAVAAICVLVTTRIVIVLQGREAQASAERIASLENEGAAIRRENLGLQSKVETERAERLKLELKFAPRSLTSDSKEIFVRTVSPSVRGIDIDVVSYEGLGTDIAALSQEIIAALTLAGAKAHLITPMGSGFIVHGIAVRLASDAPANVQNAVPAIVTGFQHAGLAAGSVANFPANEQAAGAYTSSVGAGTAKLRILVGKKPS